MPWYWHHIEVHDRMFRKVYCPECLRLAEEMRDFMKEIVLHLKHAQEARSGARGLSVK